MRSRQSIEQEAFELVRNDMANISASDEDIWKEVKKTSTTSLIVFIAETKMEMEGEAI